MNSSGKIVNPSSRMKEGQQMSLMLAILKIKNCIQDGCVCFGSYFCGNSTLLLVGDAECSALLDCQ